jgi:protein SCO1
VLHPRLRLALVLLALATSGLVVAVVAAAPEHRSSQASQANARTFAGPVLPPGIAAPSFSFNDQDQRQASLSQYRGQVVVVTFLYTHCQDTCPVTAQQIRGAFDQMGHDVPALAISVDPANDTAQSAREFLTKQHVLGRIRFLLGSAPQLAPIWRGYFVDPEGGRFEHTAFVYLVDRRGQLRIGYPAAQLTPEALAHDIDLLSAEPG